jgi:thermitase
MTAPSNSSDPSDAGSYRWALVGGALLVVVAAGVMWSLLLAPTDNRQRENVALLEGSRIAPLANPAGLDEGASAKAKAGGGLKTASPVRPLTLRISEEELRAALVGEGAVPGEVLLTFKNAKELADFRTRASLYGLKVLGADARLLSARVGYSDLGRLAEELNQHPNSYENVAANLVARIPGLPPPRGPQLDASNQGGGAPVADGLFDSIGAAGDRTGWGRNVKVAVLDSGITDHETLNGLRREQIKMVDGQAEPHGHGTSMASLIGGRVYPAEGVAPGVELLDIWVADAQGMSNTALVATGIMTAVDKGAQVINISLGSFGSSLMLQNAVQYAINNGVVIVAAAGNEQLDQLAFPAAYPGVIAVAAVDNQRRQAYFSNSGKGLTLAAPGVGIISAYPGGQVVVGSGTSQATAITSGAVAALLGWGYKSSEVAKALAQSALVTGAPPEQVGAGVLQIPRR